MKITMKVIKVILAGIQAIAMMILLILAWPLALIVITASGFYEMVKLILDTRDLGQ